MSFARKAAAAAENLKDFQVSVWIRDSDVKEVIKKQTGARKRRHTNNEALVKRQRAPFHSSTSVRP